MVQTFPNKLDIAIFKNVNINEMNIKHQVKKMLNTYPITKDVFDLWLLKVIMFIDLTTLSGDDTTCHVTKLTQKAIKPLPLHIVKKLNIKEHVELHTAAVCVYPNRVADVHHIIKKMNLLKEIQVASVATGFPSGLFPLESRLHEITFAIDNGATEIDVVIDRSLVLMGKWDLLFEEIKKMKQHCLGVHLKVILGVGELGSYENIYKASMVCMVAGVDFVKTSTGKEAVNATLPAGLVMCRAIRDYYHMSGRRVGLKPAGGIKTPQDAINWLILVYHELGREWLTPQLFRIGASGLLKEIEQYFDRQTININV